MQTVCDLNKCNGCMACVGQCSQNSISIIDDLFSYNAVINESTCICCGACESVCPNINQNAKVKPVAWYQGWANHEIRKNSSSGGAASAIIKSFIKNGGYVASCVFSDGEFLFDLTNDVEEAKAFAGSRYVKSNPMGIYEKIDKKLRSGEKVLFIGLPCQVSALKNYTQKQEELYTVDLICHGTPSPKILEKFLFECGYDINKLNDVKFRTKTQYGVIQDENKITLERVIDNYLLTFLHCVDYTENCYFCNYASFDRVSDITLGDSWGTELKHEEKNGVSLILCQTEKGIELVDKAGLVLKAVNIENAVNSNHQLYEPSKIHPRRDKFLKMLDEGKSFKNATFAVIPKAVIKQKIKLILIKVKHVVGLGKY